MSSGSVAFVGSGTSTDTLNIGSSLLSSLQTAGAVRIASQGSIDIDSAVSLGVNSGATAPTLNSLTLVGNSINNQATGASVFGAGSVLLEGATAVNAGSPPTAASVGSGTLSFVADSLTVGTGVLSVNGFAQTTAQVSGAVETRGAGYLNVGGNLTINASELTPAADGADEPGTTIATTGTLTLGAPTASASGTLPILIGGSLSLLAAAIEDGGKIAAPSGVVELISTGNVHLSSTASINAGGTSVEAVDTVAYSPGGLVEFAAGGNVTLDAGSSVSVAGTRYTPAGTLDILGANGTVTLAGTLNGASAGTTGGSLNVDAGTLTGGLMGLVSSSGLAGFSEALNVRTHTGDLDLSNGSSITANNITLTSDTGSVNVAGVLNAPSADQRGLIDLSGAGGVTLEATGQLHADGSGASGRGGEIDLNSVSASCNAGVCATTGSITLDSGSVITAYGAAQSGELVLRAPALSTGDVAINQGSLGIGADVSRVGQVIVEPVLVSSTTGATVNSDLSNDIAAASSFLSSATPTIAARLTTSSSTPISVQAGVEVQDADAGDALTLSGLDLTPYSTQGQVINVGVRAAGAITIDGTITDGFTTSTAGTVLTNMQSGSLTFVAGSDLSSANPLSTLAESTSGAALELGSQAVVRTGTGNINLAAAGDIIFDYGASGGGATVYTAGLAGATPITSGRGSSAVVENFPTEGGNVVVAAGGDVVGAALVNVNPDGGNYSVTGWQPRGTSVSTTNSSVSVGNYGVNFDKFDWNLGALGGGDVTVTSAGKISNLSVAVASSQDGTSTIYGAGGGLRVDAVGDIGSLQAYVGDGIGTITTNAGLVPILSDSLGDPVGSSFALGNAQISVWARQSVQVDAIYNPTFIPTGVTSGKSAYFFTYGADSALNLSSTDGDITLQTSVNGQSPAGVLLGSTLFNQGAITGVQVLPANLTAEALQQDVALNLGQVILYPSSTGQLSVFAGRDILGAGSDISMSDSLAVPTAANTTVGLTTTGFEIAGLAEFQGVIHTGDSQPAVFTAGRDINDLYITIPKAAQISAGRDIVDLGFTGQNVAATDTTLITAGRDITYTGSVGGISVGGPGSLDIFAGRNVDLGFSNGILTTGNLYNANLSTSVGADLTITAGYGTAGADLSSFVTDIIAPSTTYQTELVSYVEAQTGQTGLSYAQAQTVFDGLSLSQRSALVDSVFFNELLLSGRAANAGTGVGFSEGYAAIDALFPYSRNPTTANPDPYAGNLDMIYSQIYTLSGGNISIVVPGGSIDVGLANKPVGVSTKDAGQLGIVAEGAGNVDIYSQGDVNVNASRIFTLGGGNILIWSDEGSIDAGNGSKSSLSVPPPTITFASNGTVSVDYSGSLSGSGIRTVQTNPSVAAGDVDLDAPVGTVDAGDAGIGAAGNVNIAAAHVIGALNISFGGSATGVPSDLSGLAASLSGVSAVGSSATTSATTSVGESSAATRETAPLAQTALSWLEVFVTGLGEENCKQDDLECLHRQKKAAP